MRRKGLTRIQLILLFGAIGLVLWRTSTRSSDIDGVVVLSDMSEGHLYRAGLRVDQGTEIVISLTASFENDAVRAPIATYGWILNAEDRSLVWSPDRGSIVRDGVLGVVTDSIHVAPGLYEIFYTTEGPTAESRSNAPFLGLKPYWTNDTSEWSMSIAADQNESVDQKILHRVDPEGLSDAPDDLLWSTGPVGNRTANTHLFRVTAPADIYIYAIGELCSRECDFGYIEDVEKDHKIWEMTWDNTIPAGGVDANREFRGTLDLKPGIYRAGFQTNGSHAAGNWIANPPWDPDAWGISLSNVPRSTVTSYDPWTQSEPLINLTGVGDDALRKAQFRINKKSTYLISAMGEITSQRSLYDYGWLENNDSRETIWKMSYLNSNHAGGDRKNRVETVFLDLNPGTYTVYFQTDDSHSFERFGSAAPVHGERWGLAFFPVSVDGNASRSFSLLEDSWTTEQTLDEPVQRERYRDREKEALVSFERVANESHLSATFQIAVAESLYVVAAGELSTSGRYDYGWIENAENGERVWEMTTKNTSLAGGREQNRRFEGLVTLPAGTYVARYVSDFSHAYGDFDDDGPDNPGEWGMRIFQFVR